MEAQKRKIFETADYAERLDSREKEKFQHF